MIGLDEWLAGLALSANPAITAFVLVFGTIWLVGNLYGFYPLVQASLERLVERVWPWHDRDGPDLDFGTAYDGTDPPTIDLLLPAYEEAAVVDRAIRSACDLAYPTDRLSVTVILEPDDEATRSVVEGLRDSHEFDVSIVPGDYPGMPNKPRALNWAYEQTSGDVIAIVDAEDIVAPAFALDVAQAVTGGADYGQARPDMFNEDDGWLNLMFRAEYSFWYNVVVPAFDRVGYPIPLGGTSCFFRRDVLASVSERRLANRGDDWSEADWAWIRDRGLEGVRPWDPDNVTEDFEVGLTLWEHDFAFAYLTTTIREKSPPTFAEWLKQRTRWKKGKIYTFFDRVRHPPDCTRVALHVYWQSFLPHIGPINVAGVVVVLLISNLAHYRGSILVDGLLAVGLAFVLLYAWTFGLGYALASEKPLPTKLRRLAVAIGTIPLYWFAQWGADLRAIAQTYAGDHRWEGTSLDPHVEAAEGPTGPADVTRQDDNRTLDRGERLLGLGVLVALAAVLRGWALGAPSLWTDELYSIAIRGETAIGALLATGQDPHPPLYYLLLNGWLTVLGDGAVQARALSALFGLGTVVAVYLLATELFDDRTGLVAALLVATSAFFVYYSRNARMYSLVTFTTALSWYWFARLREPSRTNLAGYLVCTAALVYTHVYGLFVVLAQHVYVALSEVGGGIKSRRWLRIQFLLGVLVFPWLVAFGLQVLGILLGIGGSNISWIPDPSSVMITNTGLAFVGYPDFYPFRTDSVGLYVLASAVLFVYLGQFLASIFSFEEGLPTIEDPGPVGQLSTLVLVVIMVPFLISVVQPIYVPRYATPASIGVVILAARGLRNVPGRRVRAGLLAVLVLSSLLFVGVNITADTVEPWDRISRDVKETAGPGDVVVHQPGGGYAEYYYRDVSFTMTSIPGSERVGVSDLAYLGRLLDEHGGLTLVQYSGFEGPAVDYLRACHGSATSTTQGAITVYRFGAETGCPAPEQFMGNWSGQTSG